MSFVYIITIKTNIKMQVYILPLHQFKYYFKLHYILKNQNGCLGALFLLAPKRAVEELRREVELVKNMVEIQTALEMMENLAFVKLLNV